MVAKSIAKNLVFIHNPTDYRPASQSTIHSMLNNDPQLLNFRRAHSKEAVRLSLYVWLNKINSVL